VLFRYFGLLLEREEGIDSQKV